MIDSINPITGKYHPAVSYTNADELTIEDLPFVTSTVCMGETIRSEWDVIPSGRYADDCLVGTSYALELLQYIAVTEDIGVLFSSVMEMPRKDERSGIEVGFLSTIEEYAVSGAVREIEGATS